jgi:AraC-like DNA-binding protein
MITTVFRSEDHPREERLARFDALQTDGVHPMRVSSDRPEDFRATARALDLAAVDVVELTCAPADVLRTPKLIRRADPELYCVIVCLGGGIGVCQLGREAVLGRYDCAVYDSSHPFDLRIAPGADAATLIRVHAPRALMPLPARGADDILAVRLPAGEGVGGLFTQFLTGLTAGSASYGPADLPRLGTVALDLMTATLAHHLDAAGRVPDESRRRTLLLRIQSFVEGHLHEPRLTPAAIAAAHHISVSYVHRLFRAEGTTVSAWVRGRRLEHARRDLAEPALRGVPIHRIAARWGFADHATFTRAFRAAYDVPPGEYRSRLAEREAESRNEPGGTGKRSR